MKKTCSLRFVDEWHLSKKTIHLYFSPTHNNHAFLMKVPLFIKCVPHESSGVLLMKVPLFINDLFQSITLSHSEHYHCVHTQVKKSAAFLKKDLWAQRFAKAESFECEQTNGRCVVQIDKTISKKRCKLRVKDLICSQGDTHELNYLSGCNSRPPWKQDKFSQSMVETVTQQEPNWHEREEALALPFSIWPLDLDGLPYMTTHTPTQV